MWDGQYLTGEARGELLGQLGIKSRHFLSGQAGAHPGAGADANGLLTITAPTVRCQVQITSADPSAMTTGVIIE